VRNLIYRPILRYVVQTGGVTLLDEHNIPVCSLPYPHASLWDGLVKGYDMARCIRLFAVVARLDHQAAEDEVNNCLRQWVEARLVEIAEHG